MHHQSDLSEAQRVQAGSNLNSPVPGCELTYVRAPHEDIDQTPSLNAARNCHIDIRGLLQFRITDRLSFPPLYTHSTYL